MAKQGKIIKTLKPKILVVNPILFHYRRGVFRALDESADYEFYFASDLGSKNGIKAMKPSELRNFRRIRVSNIGHFEWYRGLIRLIQREKFHSIIFLGDVKTLNIWFISLFSRFLGIRVYFWTIGWHSMERGLKKWIRLAFYNIADELLVYGNVGYEIGQSMGYDSRRMHVIGNSVEQTSDSIMDAPILLPEKDATELWIGAVIRLTSVKRLDLLIEAAEKLITKGINTRVVLVGEGICSKELNLLANEKSVPISMPGAIYGNKELKRIYELLDITVVPSAVGLTAVQSLSYGVPVISDDSPYTQMPEWEAIIPGVTGQVYSPGNVDHLVRAIIEVKSNLELSRDKVSASCRSEYCTNWTPLQHGKRILQVLDKDTEVGHAY